MLPLELTAQKADKPNSTYDAIVKGMACKQQSSGEMDCAYDVGKSLRFAIAGVGQPDAAVTFYKVDHDDDYYAGVTALLPLTAASGITRGRFQKYGLRPARRNSSAFAASSASSSGPIAASVNSTCAPTR